MSIALLILTLILTLWFALAVGVALVAHGRMDRSGLGFFLLSMLISPILAGITLAVLGKAEPEQNQATEYQVYLPEHLADDEILLEEAEALANQFNAGTLDKEAFDEELKSRVRAAARRSASP